MTKVDDLFDARDREEAKEIEAAEREAARRGKELFSVDRLVALTGIPRAEVVEREASLRRRYYILHERMMTLAELAKHLEDVDISE